MSKVTSTIFDQLMEAHSPYVDLYVRVCFCYERETLPWANNTKQTYIEVGRLQSQERIPHGIRNCKVQKGRAGETSAKDQNPMCRIDFRDFYLSECR